MDGVKRIIGSGLSSNFWRLFGASALSHLADGVMLAALPLIAASLTRDPRIVSGITAAQGLPVLLLGLVVGSLMDRVNQRRLALVANTVRASVLAILVVATATGHGQPLFLYIVGFAFGSGQMVYDNFEQVSLPRLFGASQLVRANGWIVSSEVAGAELAGPAVGAILFPFALWLPSLFASVILVASALFIISVPDILRASTRGEATRNMLAEILDGLHWLASSRVLLRVALSGVVFSFADAAWFAVLVLYVLQILHLTAAGFGILLAVGGFGGLVGGLSAARAVGFVGQAGALALSLILAATAQAALGLTNETVVAALMLALSSYAVALWNVASVSIRQQIVPVDLLGRVNAAYRTMVGGAAPVGALVGGALATSHGLTSPFLAGAPLLLACAALSYPIIKRESLST